MRRFARNLCALAVFAAVAAPAANAGGLCQGHRGPGVRCQPGHGRHTSGGGHKTSHSGWPHVTGILWIVVPATKGKADGGTWRNDELLGSHGNDTLGGGPGHDILWGDQLPTGNNGWQHDRMSGGPGDDWIYSSHGYNSIDGGPGNDHIWGHYGHGAIDCGSGWDVVHVKRHPAYRLRNCERVLHH